MSVDDSVNSPSPQKRDDQLALGTQLARSPTERDFIFQSQPPGSPTHLSVLSPTDITDEADPGDETQRNYRYQASVGAILVIAMRLGKIPCVAVWCEQFEDFLCEYPDGTFDAVQVKTSTPENGPWQIKSEAFLHSMRRFSLLSSAFPGCFRRFRFVSNVALFDSDSEPKKHLCISKLRDAARAVTDQAQLKGPMRKGFDLLLEKVNEGKQEKVLADTLFSVLKLLRTQKGPSREDMHDVLCQSHLPDLPDCANASPRQLSDIVKRLVARVLEASSMHIETGVRHYAAFLEGNRPPEVEAKRLAVVDLDLIVSEQRLTTFSYLPTLKSLKIGEERDQASDTRLMELKLKHGGVPDESCVILHRQAISAEQRLLDLVTRTEYGVEMYAQLENVVRQECSVVALEASLDNGLYGKKMLLNVHKRFREVAHEEVDRVRHEGVEMLLGIAGLLTGQCHIWWSEKFNIPELT